jgi:hypothetical protein
MLCNYICISDSQPNGHFLARLEHLERPLAIPPWDDPLVGVLVLFRMNMMNAKGTELYLRIMYIYIYIIYIYYIYIYSILFIYMYYAYVSADQ